VLYADEGKVIAAADLSPRINPDASREDGAEGSGNRSPVPLENMLDDFERRVITETLKLHDYNVARAATALGLGSRQTLYKKLKRLAINVGDFLQDDSQPGLQLRS
jgi:DNA-binding NtrC family response regulator